MDENSLKRLNFFHRRLWQLKIEILEYFKTDPPQKV